MNHFQSLTVALPTDSTLQERIVRPNAKNQSISRGWTNNVSIPRYSNASSTIISLPSSIIEQTTSTTRQNTSKPTHEIDMEIDLIKPTHEKPMRRIQPIHTGPIPTISTPTIFSTAPYWTKSSNLKPQVVPVTKTIDLIDLFQAYKLYVPTFFLLTSYSWRNIPGLSTDLVAIIQDYMDNLVITHKDSVQFYPTVAANGQHIFGVLPSTFSLIRQQLESMTSTTLPSLPPVQVQLNLTNNSLDFPLEPRVFESKEEYLNMMQAFFLHNKQLAQEQRRHDTLLHSLRHLFFSHISLRKQSKTYLCLDIEAWEQDHDKILEIGWATAHWDDDWQIKGTHLIVQENLHLRNGFKVADHRDEYNFGNSQILPLKKCMQRLKSALKTSDFIVGHAASSDERFLRRFGVTFSGKPVLDTQVIAKSVMGTTDTLRLSRILDHLGLDHHHLHNAGNDAYYTLEAFLKMCISSPKTVARMIGVDWVGFVEQSKIRSSPEDA